MVQSSSSSDHECQANCTCYIKNDTASNDDRVIDKADQTASFGNGKSEVTSSTVIIWSLFNQIALV